MISHFHIDAIREVARRVIAVAWDNLEIIVAGVDEVLTERWWQIRERHLTLLIQMLCTHLRLQYEGGMCESLGADVRGRVIAVLLSITADANDLHLCA